MNCYKTFLIAGKKTSLPPRWAARFNTRGWRLGFGCSGVVLCLSMKRCRSEQVCSIPSREAAPSERPSCRLKAFLKHTQFTWEHGSGLGARALACAPGTFNCHDNTKRGSPCKGWAKKILPVAIAEGGDFFRPACEALAGGKKAFKAARKRTPLSRPRTHTGQ